MTSIGFGACSGNAAGTTSGGALSQLVALGSADSHLTADPSVTFWRSVTEKCSNFAMESIIQTFTGQSQWGGSVNITLNRTGDLIYWQYVLVDVPAISGVQSSSAAAAANANGCAPGQYPSVNHCDACEDGDEEGACYCYDPDCLVPAEPVDGVDPCTGVCEPYANWVNEIGHAALTRVCFSIGGQVIDSLYSHYLHIWEELAGTAGKRLTEMVGKRFTTAQVVADSQRNRRLYVPLPFWFTRHSSNALPLVSLQFHSVQVSVTFAPLNKMIQVSAPDVYPVVCATGQAVSNNDIRAVMDTTYVYLDLAERDRFAVGCFNQLITTLQQFSTTMRAANGNFSLNFNHPSLELIWFAQRACEANANNTFNYSGKYGLDPITRAGLRINNLVRFDREAAYFRLVQPWQHHSLIPQSYVYNYSFALDPESCSPSGSLNFSRIDNVNFNVDLQPDLATENVSIAVFCRSFNVLRFREGLGGLLYSS